MDESKRMPLWRKAHAIAYDDQPYTFIAFSKALVFMDNRFENVQRVRLGLNSPGEWFVPASRQRYK